VDVAGSTLVDTVDTMIVFETSLEPRLYVDAALVRTDLLRRTDSASYCNYKGVGTYWAAVVGDTVILDIAWSYEEPMPETMPIKGFLSFDAERADVLAELPSHVVAPRTAGAASNATEGTVPAAGWSATTRVR
jgi:uncharacterized protein (DUF427 family)